MEYQAEVLLATHSPLGEGALWDAQAQRLAWIDIIGKKVYLYDPVTGENRAYAMPTMVGTVVPRVAGGYVVALENAFAFLDPATGALTPLAIPEVVIAGHRFNDGKCDPAGRFWCGMMPLGPRAYTAALWCLYPDGHVEKKLEGIACSNGIVWTKDKRTMYYTDTPTHRIDAFDYDNATGAITNQRGVYTFAQGQGSPDGFTIDENDTLWVALWGGSRVEHIDPVSGKLLDTIHLPGVKNVTSCAFGGPDMDTLYITSSGQGAKAEEQPNAGNLFVVKLPHRGVKAAAYAG